jgi:predicted helicase
VKTSRGEFLVDVERDERIKRLEIYFDPEISHEEMRQVNEQAMAGTSNFKAIPTRNIVLKRGFLPKNIIRFQYRPLDVRWLYWEPETNLVDGNRADYFSHVFDGNIWLAAVQQNRKHFDPPISAFRMCSLHVIERGANMFPLWLRHELDSGVSALRETPDMFSPQSDGGGGKKENITRPNLSDAAAAYSAGLKVKPDALFYHTLAVLHSPEYRNEKRRRLAAGLAARAVAQVARGVAGVGRIGPTSRCIIRYGNSPDRCCQRKCSS